MRLIEHSSELCAAALRDCAFVPTMGALHEGHASLARLAGASGRPVIVSIFVNPTQFGPNEDYSRYPRTLEADCALLEPLGVAAVFVPSVEAIYPRGMDAARAEAALLALPQVATQPRLEDACRPTHFAGVAQVVGRLFDLVKPSSAFFGEKDYQQLRLIEEMVHADRARYGALSIERCPTIRENGGLAMSSRNRYLAPQERDAALALSRAISAAKSHATVAAAEASMQAELSRCGLTTEYAVVRDADTLLPVADFSRPTRALIAARIGSTRLIDNDAIAARKSVCCASLP